MKSFFRTQVIDPLASYLGACIESLVTELMTQCSKISVADMITSFHNIYSHFHPANLNRGISQH